MTIQTLTDFFMWCSIINGALLTLTALLFLAVPNFVYHAQNKWFPMPRETFNTMVYAFVGLHKIAFVIFSIVPYVALLIIG